MHRECGGVVPLQRCVQYGTFKRSIGLRRRSTDMDGVSVLILIVTVVIALVALRRTAKLDRRLADLGNDVAALRGQMAALRLAPEAVELAGAGAVAAAPAPTAPVIGETPETEPAPVALEQAELPAPAPEPSPQAPQVPQPAARDLEQSLASRWFVWIGGAAIAVGGLLFVKYAYDTQLISPSVQIVLGVLLGAVLVAAGEFVRRRSRLTAEPNYVPAALSAAGLATAFGAIYGGYALYQLYSPTVAFVGLAIVAIGAFALSFLQGPFIAALGLIGSLAIPAMISSEHPSAWGLFPYLLVILVASFATLRGRNWWWLGYCAIAGVMAWSLMWIAGPFAVADTLVIGVFAHLIGIIAFYGLLGRSVLADEAGDMLKPTSISNPLAIGLAGLAAEALVLIDLVTATNHAPLALGLFALAALGLLGLGWVKRGLAPLAVIAAVLSFVVLMNWNDVAIHQLAIDEYQLWSTVLGPEARVFLQDMFIAGAVMMIAGCAGLLRKPNPVLWGTIAGLAPVLFVIGAFARVDMLLSPWTWAVIAAAAALVLLALGLIARDRLKEPWLNLAHGLASIGASLLSLFAADRMLDNIWLTLALAALVPAFTVLVTLTNVRLQASIAAAFGSLAVIRLFLSRELWHDDKSLPLGAHWPIYGYGVPAALFLASSRILKSSGFVRAATTLEGLCLGLVISLISLELRVLIAGGVTTEAPQFLEMSAHILAWLGAAYGLMYRQQVFSSFIAKWGTRLLIAASCAAIIGFSLTTLNPVVTEEPVLGNVVFNALLLAYLAPAVLLVAVARKLEAIGWQQLRLGFGVLALVLCFGYITFETKRVFEGHLLQMGGETLAENYAYSAVWLAFAVALFAAGLRFAIAHLRYAGLAVMLLVVLKVFLWDMSNLEGLFRIASFIGLGLCLVGIGWLYQRVGPRAAKQG